MSKFDVITDKALDLVGQAGSNFRHVVPSATRMLQTGVALGAAKTGGRVALSFVRRNPLVAFAAALGVGAVAYAASRKRKQQEAGGTIEGRSRRVEAKRVGNASKRNGSTAGSSGTTRKPRARKSTGTTASAD